MSVSFHLLETYEYLTESPQLARIERPRRQDRAGERLEIARGQNL